MSPFDPGTYLLDYFLTLIAGLNVHSRSCNSNSISIARLFSLLIDDWSYTRGSENTLVFVFGLKVQSSISNSSS